MKLITTVVIGIPAYNEASNISSLLLSLLAQDTLNYKLESIIVASDGSTDNTIELVQALNNRNIQMIDNNTRSGQAYVQNQIIRRVKSDVLILLNADIKIEDKNFISKLITPIIKKKSDMTSCLISPLVENTLLFNVLTIGTKVREQIAKSINHGNNIYNCHGRVRAMSKQLYSKLVFKGSLNEDAYSYLYAKYLHLKFIYVVNTRIFYKLPSHIFEHFKQSNRFVKNRDILYAEFGANAVEQSYSMPLSKVLTEFVTIFLHQPVNTFIYIVITLIGRVISLFYTQDNLWSVAKSSKKLQ